MMKIKIDPLQKNDINDFSFHQGRDYEIGVIERLWCTTPDPYVFTFSFYLR